MTIDRRALLALPLAVSVAPTFAAAETGDPSWSPPERFPLWPGTPPNASAQGITRPAGALVDQEARGIARPEVGVFRAARPDGRAVLVVPGGGYGFVSLGNEGTAVAAALNRLGVTAFVLAYRLPGEGWVHREDVPLADAQRAMRLIRANAARYAVDPARLGVLGFSAGGHLAGSVSTQSGYRAYAPVDAADRLDARPAYTGLMYAVSNVDPGRSHGGSRDNLLGPVPAPGAQARYDVERNITPATPPLFILHAQDDATVPFRNGLDLFAAARAAGLKSEAHFLLKGGHGFGAGLPSTNPGALWPDMFVRWAGEVGG